MDNNDNTKTKLINILNEGFWLVDLFNKFNKNWLKVTVNNTRVEVNNLYSSGNEESNLMFECI